MRLYPVLLSLAAASYVSANSLVARARQALAERQSSGPNAVQNWANDYATETFTTGANGLFTVNWNNGPGGQKLSGGKGSC
jgi:hypothetical protein